jgi:hypothetical protein
VTKQGNAKFELEGIGQDDEELKGGSENFKVKVPVDNLDGTIPELVVKFVRVFFKTVKSGLVKVEADTVEKINMIADIQRRLNDAGE